MSCQQLRRERRELLRCDVDRRGESPRVPSSERRRVQHHAFSYRDTAQRNFHCLSTTVSHRERLGNSSCSLFSCMSTQFRRGCSVHRAQFFRLQLESSRLCCGCTMRRKSICQAETSFLIMNPESSRGCMRNCRRTSMRQQCVPEVSWSMRRILSILSPYSGARCVVLLGSSRGRSFGLSAG
jgi:hypothetical protein